MVKFLYTPIWTIPIDNITSVTPDDDYVSISTLKDGVTKEYWVRPKHYQNKSVKDIYENIQRQLAEAEEC